MDSVTIDGVPCESDFDDFVTVIGALYDCDIDGLFVAAGGVSYITDTDDLCDAVDVVPYETDVGPYDSYIDEFCLSADRVPYDVPFLPCHHHHGCQWIWVSVWSSLTQCLESLTCSRWLSGLAFKAEWIVELHP